ncbi:discoidin domain-containing protein [Streptomyces sp. NPDC088197]|uniref:discoidin domain-containing protein n=1 Tax=unclassified Streptomyces TaxID=2593676 RepID=UPI0036E88D7D
MRAHVIRRTARRGLAPLAVAALVAAGLAVVQAPAAQAAGSVVKVTGSQGNWQLTVDGAPYTVKGLTWGPQPSQAAADLPDVARMGVNTIRTWGTDASSAPLFDAAAANGIKVIAGFWLQPGGGPGSGGCVDYLTDTTYKNNMLAEFPKWVNTYKDNPGVLMWDVGNESVLGLQNCYSGDQLEQERNAYTSFVNDLSKAVHAADPNHPVTSTDAWTGAWPYYKRNTPDLDLLAVNSYKDVCNVKSAWESGGYDKPYIITEGGPAGSWEVPNDANGVADEPTDQQKADGYTNAWNCVAGHPGVALGATLFHYGNEDDFGGIWFNLVPDGLKRPSYYAVKRAYGGNTSGDNQPPLVTDMTVDNATSGVPAGGTVTITTSTSDPENDPITYQVLFSSIYIDNNGSLTPAATTQNGGTLTAKAPEKVGVYEAYVRATDNHGNVSYGSKSVRIVPPKPNGTNVALNKPATASTYQTDPTGGCPCTPSNAVDGNAGTRWASDWSDPQWIQVDLGATTAFHHVQLSWESAYAKAYDIQTSDDGQNWTTVKSVTDGNGDIDDLDVSGTGRYVRLTGTQRGTAYGYSLYEFGVYN